MKQMEICPLSDISYKKSVAQLTMCHTLLAAHIAALLQSKTPA